MKNPAGKTLKLDTHLGCFGEFDGEDAVCRKLCALRLRCAIEHEQNMRLEVLEDLVSCDSPFILYQ